MAKFKLIIKTRGHDFFVDDKKVWGVYQHPTFNGDYMYLSPYWGDKIAGVYKIEMVAEEKDIETWDNSTNEMLKIEQE